MKLIGRADFEEWNPDFSSSAQADPDWVRVRFEQLELCNSLSEVEWGETPVQVRLCEECGQPGCGSGGYVHLSVADDVVLWTAPQVDRSDEWAVVNFAESELVRRFGALAIPADEWAEHYDLYYADGETPMSREDIPLFRALQGESVRDL